MLNKQFIPTEVTDALSNFILGMDSNAPTTLLPSNQAAYLSNTTNRGGYLTDRPPYKKLSISYGGNSEIQSAVETGLWQGACFYQPDFGSSAVIASISGRIFKFGIVGDVVTCSEISIPGDLNDDSATQVWLWQAEQWVIINDGKNLPIFYDGATSRRSYGSRTTLNNSSADWIIPAIGASASVSLTAPYAGPFNAPIYVDGVYYQASQIASGYDVILTTLYNSTSTSSFSSGNSVMSEPVRVGYLTNDFVYGTAGYFAPNSLDLSAYLSTATGVSVGALLLIDGKLWKVSSINVGGNPKRIKVKNQEYINAPYGVAAGNLVQYSSSSSPNVKVGDLVGSLAVPAVGSSVTATLTLPYTGTPGAIVYIQDVQFTIVSAGVSPGTNLVNLINLSDGNADGVNYRGPTPGAANKGPGTISSVPELPAGRMGVYGLGRNWMSLTDAQSYIGSDIVGGSSGSQAYTFRDSVLKVTENTYLAGGGVFRVPNATGEIRAMIFAATLDSSLGQGPLQVFTPTRVFSCNAPVDRTKWQDLTNPIQTESLIGNGALGHYSTINVNSDIMYRALDGWRALILARREFTGWPNTPISNEMERILNLDDDTLLNYGSAVNFNNRVLYTANPKSSANGVYHPATVVINNDLLSSMREKIPAAYDGAWTGINVLQYVTGMFSGLQRAFAFTLNTVLSKIEFYEILPTGKGYFDNGNIPIVWSGESPALFNNPKIKDQNTLMRLLDGEIRVDDLIGRVDFQFFYKPDDYPCWIPWHSWTECFNKPSESNSLQPGYRPRMGLGEPDPEDCDVVNNRPFREFYFCQVKWIITGHCRITGMRFKGVTIPQTQFAPPNCDTCETTSGLPPSSVEPSPEDISITVDRTDITVDSTIITSDAI